MIAPALLLLGLRLHGVVDQVDAGIARVEWEGRAFGDLPAALLPDGCGEGDRIVLRVRRGPVSFIPTRAGHIEVPAEVAPRGWRVVVASPNQRRAR